MDALKTWAEAAGYVIEAAGVFVIAAGCLAASVWFVLAVRTVDPVTAYTRYWIVLARVG